MLALCLFHGVATTSGLPMPPDLDALRDIGFAQGFLDHDWFGDPTTAGATRYYPPLVPALAALVAWLSGNADLPKLWVLAGPWTGLLPVALFFGLCRRLCADAEVAFFCTAVFVFVNGNAVAPWIGGGSTPWLLVPLLTQAAFAATAWLIHVRVRRAGWVDAVMIGFAIGITFLAHVVPAMLLTVMLVAAFITAHGVTGRGFAWLALAGAVQLLTMAPYLLPLLIAYPAGIIHTAPGAWTDQAMYPDLDGVVGILLLNAPAVIATCVLWRLRVRADRITVAMLAAWIGLCVLALVRHYGCGIMDPNTPGCALLRMPAHHFHFYLQIADALLIGWAIRAVAQRAARHREAMIAAGLLLMMIGSGLLFSRAYDSRASAAALDPAETSTMDLGAYRWILANTPVDALFVTDVEGDQDGHFDTGAFAVMAAGRKLVAAHMLFSNPYIAWAPRETQRKSAVAWLAGAAEAPPCLLFRNGLWAVMKPDKVEIPTRARLVFRSPAHYVLAVSPIGCSP